MHVIFRHRSKQELDVLGSSLFSFFFFLICMALSKF